MNWLEQSEDIGVFWWDVKKTWCETDISSVVHRYGLVDLSLPAIHIAWDWEQGVPKMLEQSHNFTCIHGVLLHLVTGPSAMTGKSTQAVFSWTEQFEITWIMQRKKSMSAYYRGRTPHPQTSSITNGNLSHNSQLSSHSYLIDGVLCKKGQSRRWWSSLENRGLTTLGQTWPSL